MHTRKQGQGSLKKKVNKVTTDSVLNITAFSLLRWVTQV